MDEASRVSIECCKGIKGSKRKVYSGVNTKSGKITMLRFADNIYLIF